MLRTVSCKKAACCHAADQQVDPPHGPEHQPHLGQAIRYGGGSLPEPLLLFKVESILIMIEGIVDVSTAIPINPRIE